MKLIKYLIAALLVVSITKKVHVASSHAIKDKNVKYNAITKTASIDTTYVGVEEYNQAVTPPNLEIPALKLFATIPTPHYKRSGNKQVAGGLNASTSLYGIPVTGLKYPVKTDTKTIGFYWPTSKIVQLNNGQTFVGVKEEVQGNYKEFHALGPIWTRFLSAEIQEIFKLYNISLSTDTKLKDRVKNIGTVRKNKQAVKLYGLLLNATSMPETGQSFAHTFQPEKILKSTQKAILDNPNEMRKQMHLKVATAYPRLQQPEDQISVSTPSSNNPGFLYAMKG
jgi:hypothetical protein